jgi:phage terminase large subunit
LEAAKYVGTGARVFFGGSRGGGKTHWALACAVIASKRFPGLKTTIVRHTQPELLENFIIPLTTKYPEHLFRYKYKQQQKVAVFQNGSRIVFKSIERARDAEKVQGIEYQLLIVDEAPNYDEYVLTTLVGSLRRKVSLTNFIPTVLMTGNPGGMSDYYFKTRFIRPDYRVWSEGELSLKNKFVFRASSVEDNKYVGEEYVDNLKSMPPHLYEAWYKGNWDIFEGQFFETFNRDRDVIAPFEIPADWNRTVGFDLGYTSKHPTVAIWVAQNPDTLDLYVYREYASKHLGKDTSIEVIINDLHAMMDNDEGVIFCDPSIWTNLKKTGADMSPGLMMQTAGLPVLPANNQRVNGWRILKSWMLGKLKIFDTCPGLITTLPTLKYTPYNRGKKEDLDTEMQDDYADALRYVVVTGFGAPTHDHDEPIVHEAKTYLQNSDRVLEHDDWVDRYSLASY